MSTTQHHTRAVYTWRIAYAIRRPDGRWSETASDGGPYQILANATAASERARAQLLATGHEIRIRSHQVQSARADESQPTIEDLHP